MTGGWQLSRRNKVKVTSIKVKAGSPEREKHIIVTIAAIISKANCELFNEQHCNNVNVNAGVVVYQTLRLC